LLLTGAVDGRWPLLQTCLHEGSHMPDINTLSKRPLEYSWETGVSPLFSGSIFFLLGASGLLKRFLPQTAFAQQGVSWLVICLVAVAILVAKIWGTRGIGRTWLLLPIVLVPLVLVPLVSAYAFTSYGRPSNPYPLNIDRLVMPGFAVLFGVLSLYYYVRKQETPALLAYGIYLMCLALLIWWLPLSSTERGDLLNSGAGGPLAVFGAMRLREFLRTEPKPVER
jgi:hypothetical protein